MLDSKSILVTGAGGFIGARVVEVLEGIGAKPIAGIRRWGTAARVARLAVDIRPCDVLQPDQVLAASAGVSGIVHCAVGPSEVTIDGTRNVLQAALTNGVERVVFLSTIDVHSPTSGQLTEDSPCNPSGAAYGDSKIQAEAVCREFMARGLAVTILRPTIVYGPFSANWTVEFAERLPVRPWPFPGEMCQGTCNLVYIDDLVSAILLSLVRPEAVGEAFTISGPEQPTWDEYFAALNAALGLPSIETQAAARSRFNALVGKPVRATAKTAMRYFEPQIMNLYKRSQIAKKAMKGVESWIRKTPTTNEFDLYGKVVLLSSAKAERLLGYTPAFSMADGVALSVEWLRHSGYGNGSPTP